MPLSLNAPAAVGAVARSIAAVPRVASTPHRRLPVGPSCVRLNADQQDRVADSAMCLYGVGLGIT